VSYAEHKARVVELIDATYEATLSQLPARSSSRQPAIPCRSAGGSGGATGDYEPSGGIEVPLRDMKPAELAERIRAYWEGRGFEITSVGEDHTVLARDGDFQLSLGVYPRSDVAVIGASGPCATPVSETERKARPKFKSVARRGEER